MNTEIAVRKCNQGESNIKLREITTNNGKWYRGCSLKLVIRNSYKLKNSLAW